MSTHYMDEERRKFQLTEDELTVVQTALRFYGTMVRTVLIRDRAEELAERLDWDKAEILRGGGHG